MEVDKMNVEETESKDFVYGGLIPKEKYKGCIRCLELYDKVTKANDECVQLELDIVKKNSAIKSLDGEIGYMELENLKIENEVRALKQRNEELEKRIRSCQEEGDKLAMAMIENKVLDCEKKKAETETGSWKAKCKELEMKMLELEKRLFAGTAGGPSSMQNQDEAKDDKYMSGTPTNNSSSKQHTPSEEFKGGRKFESQSRVRKCVDFSGDGSQRHNISPSTPGVKPRFVPIEISDSDDDHHSQNIQSSTGFKLNTLDEKELSSKVVVEDDSDEEKDTCYIARSRNLPLRKRRKVAYVVTCESDSDSDDNIPLCRLVSKNRLAHSSDACSNGGESSSRDNHKKNTPKRASIKAGKNEEKEDLGNSSYKSTGNPKNLGTAVFTNDSADEDDTENDDSSSEGESLGGFIVSESDDMSENDDRSDDLENASESSVAYDEVISGLRRGRKDKRSWEYEADMLADLAKCPELCMKGVCAIYRRQTCEEKSSQATLFLNRRGFSQIHASSGSDLAEFLTDGDPHGDVQKTVEELQVFDPKGVNKCINLARHYSRQLFEIYKTGEDPSFHP